VVQPHGVADDLGGEPMAIVRVGRQLHAPVSSAAEQATRAGYRDNAVANGVTQT
jgi:hypothetical protein